MNETLLKNALKNYQMLPDMVARFHAEVLYSLKRVNRFFGEDANLPYYSRLIPVFEGKYECPVCTARYNLLNDLSSGKEDITKFLSYKELYHTAVDELAREEVKRQIAVAYHIDASQYFELLRLVESDAIRTFKTDRNMIFHAVDPIVYFGLLYLHNPVYVTSPAVISSEGAIREFFKTMHRIENQEGNLAAYVKRNYKLSQKELIYQALNLGEQLVKRIQEDRQLTRWNALMYCVEFNVVTDLYILSCAEFPLHGDKLIALRNRIASFADDTKTPTVVALKKAIREVREEFYEQGKRNIDKTKRKSRAGKRNSPTLREQWHGNG